MTADINWDLFEDGDLGLYGNYRAIVENNVDPLNAGRVQVRIDGLHSPFSSETPTEHLIWAEQVSPLYWSGGHNSKNPDYSNKKIRYTTSGSELTIPSKLSPVQIPKTGIFPDPIEDDCGTGGIFTVPRKGTIVWIFFENGDHTRCHYFGGSTKALDWKEQRDKITQDVNDKRDALTVMRSKFKPDKTSHIGTGPSNGAQVATFCSTPRVNIFPIDDIPQEDVTSITSKQGTTIIIVNQKGKERVYILNKGSGTCIDEWGHKKEIVGITNSEGQKINCNDEKVVAGHSELHVIGDYDLYSTGNIFIQGDSNIQINGKNNVGIVVREGDADIVVEQGNVNVDSKRANVNVHSGNNVQIQSDANTVIKATGNASIAVNGIAAIEATQLNLKASGALNLEGQTVSIKSNSTVEIEASKSLNVLAVSSFTVDGQGFTGDVAVNAPISNAFHTGTFPGPGAGPAITTQVIIRPIISAPEIPFTPSIKTMPVNTSELEKTNNTDSPLTPSNTSIPT